MHEQFREHAANYAKKYGDVDAWAARLREGFAAAGIDPADLKPQMIIDVGSGSGNTIFPLLELFPSATVVASDLAAELLAILRDNLDGPAASRVALLQANAEAMPIKPASCDLVVGAAILHHLFEPAGCLRESCGLLRPGGIAMYVEPCQHGKILVRQAYDCLLRDARAAELDPVIRQHMHDRIAFIDLRLRHDRDKSDPIFEQLDDKWMFSIQHMREMGEAAGFERTVITRVDAHVDNLLVREFGVHFRRSYGEDALPEWA